jgi:hypothetical protein
VRRRGRIRNESPVAGSCRLLAGVELVSVVPGGILMNIESLAVNVLALGAAVRTSYGAGQPPLHADNGYVRHPDGVLSPGGGSST